MRRAKADFEIFTDDGETTKSLKRSERPGKEGSKSKSPPSETRPATKGTARPKKTVTETAGLKVLGNNSKENIDPRFGKPAGKKKNGNTSPKTDTALQSPPNKVLTALNNKNHNVLPGKSLKQARPIDKPAQCTPKPKQAPPKTSTFPFSPLADITAAYNSKCPTPLPLSVSFSGTSTVTVERRLEQASAAILKTGVSELHTELHILPSFEEGKKTELGKINKLREDISLKPVIEGEDRIYSAIRPTEPKLNQLEDRIDDNRSRCYFSEHTKEPAATKDAPGKIIKVLRSSSPSTMKPILSGSGNSSTDAHRAAEISAPATPTQNDWSKQESKERSNNSINNLKRESLNNVDVNDEYPNKRYRDENYIACTDLLEIKLGADRSVTTTPEKKPSFKRFILECAPGW